MAKRTSDPHAVSTPDGDARGFSFALEFDTSVTPVRLSLRALHRVGFGSISIDWAQPELQRRIAAGKRQPLARAVGLHKPQTRPLRILDATAGLGRDGYTLAALGAEVTLAERNATVVELLRDAHRRALADPAQCSVAARIDILAVDAAEVLDGARAWDVIYLDPMYPDDGKRALPSKEMQILRDLNGGDDDADALLAPALNAALGRVVVKRPAKAPHLADRAPSMSLNSTQLRFDVYIHANAPSQRDVEIRK